MITAKDVQNFKPELEISLTEETDIPIALQLDSLGIIDFILYLEEVSKVDFFNNSVDYEDIKTLFSINLFISNNTKT